MKKKACTKYDYYRIYAEMGAAASVFALTAMSAALLLGAVAAAILHYRQDGGLGLSSWLCLAVFALSLPSVAKNARSYRNLKKKLREKSEEELEKDPDFHVDIPTVRQVWLIIALLCILAVSLLALAALLIWLMSSAYDTAFFILCLLLIALSVPVLRMLVAYLQLLPIVAELTKTERSEQE